MIKPTDMFTLGIGDFMPSPPPHPRTIRRKRHPIGDLKPLTLVPLAPRDDSVPSDDMPSPHRPLAPPSPMLAAGATLATIPPDDGIRRTQLFQDLCAIESHLTDDDEAATTQILKSLQMAVSPHADCIVLYTTSATSLDVAGSTGGHLLVGQSFGITTCIASKVLSTRKPLCIANLQSHASYYHAMDIDGLLGTRTIGYIAYPIILHGQIQGILELRSCHTSAIDIDLFLISTVVPSIQTMWAAKKAPLNHTLLHRVASALSTTSSCLADAHSLRRNHDSSASLFAQNAHADLQRALMAIQTITQANAVYVFELGEGSRMVTTIASTKPFTRTASSSSGKQMAHVDFSVVAASLFQHTARPRRVAPLDVVWFLTSDSSIHCAMAVALDSAHCVMCTAASMDAMEPEDSDVWLFVKPVAAQGWVLDHVKCREENQAGLLNRLTALLQCNNMIWQAHDGGTKLGLLCTAGANFFGTSLFSFYVCDTIHNELWAFTEHGVCDAVPLLIGASTVVGECVQANEVRVLNAVTLNANQAVVGADDGDASHSCVVLPIVDSNGHVIAVSQALFPIGSGGNLDHLSQFKSGTTAVFATTVATILMKSPALLTYTKFQLDRKRSRPTQRARNDSAASFLYASGALRATPSQRVLQPFHTDASVTMSEAIGRLTHRMPCHQNPPAASSPRRRQVVPVVASIATTEFNVFAYSFAQLHGILADMFHSMNLLTAFDIAPTTFAAFVAAVEHHHRDVRYHNFYHAFSVTQMAYTLLAPNPVASVEDLDLIAALVACLGHDLDHPGHSNDFEVATASDLALRYNDVSVLENHSIAVLFSILRDPVTNIFATLTKAQYAAARSTIVQCIIHTDMQYHADLVAHLAYHVDVSELEFQKQTFLNLVVHASDVGALGHPHDAVVQWVDRILDEFQSQASKSVALDIPLAPHLLGLDDKRTQSMVQLNFLNYIVLPLWAITAHLLPHAKPILDRMYSHREYFSQLLHDE
ncbi:hypothetical protein H310_11652 [Aphanomyces invadans]|uniref:Phosphodiesterase n=1 Tax=Aphanomyces invadans TaxID=157072 RepID=A0A024TM09_9STRA|nr:hypothetical protein H310_11652 [Aphanomyces invadans]ETV94666.1 hypothetical protein H310_11652 [Aphanomyces invadans]|eukprot:XP_008876611.1 hypothetical protein H310_11652 [Aphanomyces invadans]